MTEEYVDLVEAGIIDPAKVTRTALENAASVAGMILTTEALVTELPEKKSARATRVRRRHVRLTEALVDLRFLRARFPLSLLHGESGSFTAFVCAPFVALTDSVVARTASQSTRMRARPGRRRLRLARGRPSRASIGTPAAWSGAQQVAMRVDLATGLRSRPY